MNSWKVKALNELYLHGFTETPTSQKRIILEDILLDNGINYNIVGDLGITINKGHDKLRELI